MIVKNEENTLERCLRSVEGIPDEIVIVDTGSGDATKKIAHNFTPKVLDFTWVDDFSAARNYSFDQATMDYILWLDADDVLLPADRIKLLELKNALAPTVDAVSMLYHTAFDDSGNVTQSSRRLRLVRRQRNFAWVGVVHEDLKAAGAFYYFDSDIVVTHKKPTGEPGPARRNLLIYERYLEAGGTLGASDLFHYARECDANNDLDKAIQLYRQFLEFKEEEVGLDLILGSLHKLATCYHKTGNLEKEWECTLRSLELDVPRPEFSCRFGEHFLKDNRFRQAIFWYELALQDRGDSVGDRMVHNYPFKTWVPHKQLGLCYYRIGDYESSLHHNKLARQYLPDDPDVETNIRLLEKLVNESAGSAVQEAGESTGDGE
jgi:glycosyltransferase involved in cell wall biosynthesis